MDKEISSKELLLLIIHQLEEDQNLDDHNGAIIGDRLKKIATEGIHRSGYTDRVSNNPTLW